MGKNGATGKITVESSVFLLEIKNKRENYVCTSQNILELFILPVLKYLLVTVSREGYYRFLDWFKNLKHTKKTSLLLDKRLPFRCLENMSN